MQLQYPVQDPASAPFTEQAAVAAASMGVVVDVFAAARGFVGLQTLEPLVNSTGGALSCTPLLRRPPCLRTCTGGADYCMSYCMLYGMLYCVLYGICMAAHLGQPGLASSSAWSLEREILGWVGGMGVRSRTAAAISVPGTSVFLMSHCPERVAGQCCSHSCRGFGSVGFALCGMRGRTYLLVVLHLGEPCRPAGASLGRCQAAGASGAPATPPCTPVAVSAFRMSAVPVMTPHLCKASGGS